MLLYSSLLMLVLVLGAPYWLLRMVVSGRYRAGLSGRVGVVPADLRDAVQGREVVWLHAVSVGEVMAAADLVQALAGARPGLVVAVSTTTKTGQELAKKRLAEMPVFYLPLDFGWSVRRYLRVLKPRLLVLMESELWPNLLRECGRMEVPVVVVNARISDRSFPRYMRLQRLWRPLLRRVTIFLAQGEETAGRLRAIGVNSDRIRVVGNLKYDLRAVADTPAVALLKPLLSGRKLLVAGSTLEGEERLLLDAWTGILKEVPEAVLLLAPRHPDRFQAVGQLAEKRAGRVYRVSAMKRAETDEITTLATGCVVLLDTIGDLAAVYSLAAVAFIGGSLVTAGGHNPLEPARFGVPVVIGSDFRNFREVVEMMQAMDGIRVVTSDQMPTVLTDLLCEDSRARALGERGRTVFASQTGATARIVGQLVEILESVGAERRT